MVLRRVRRNSIDESGAHMDNDTRMVKATLAAAVLPMVTNLSQFNTKSARDNALKHVAEVTEDLFKALFPTK
jgi:hypothetical protein